MVGSKEPIWIRRPLFTGMDNQGREFKVYVHPARMAHEGNEVALLVTGQDEQGEIFVADLRASYTQLLKAYGVLLAFLGDALDEKAKERPRGLRLLDDD